MKEDMTSHSVVTLRKLDTDDGINYEDTRGKAGRDERGCRNCVGVNHRSTCLMCCGYVQVKSDVQRTEYSVVQYTKLLPRCRSEESVRESKDMQERACA